VKAEHEEEDDGSMSTSANDPGKLLCGDDTRTLSVGEAFVAAAGNTSPSDRNSGLGNNNGSDATEVDDDGEMDAMAAALLGTRTPPTSCLKLASAVPLAVLERFKLALVTLLLANGGYEDLSVVDCGT
jgi:hypothetical protein